MASRKSKTTKKGKAAKEPKPKKKEKAPKEELCVFAFRLTPEERSLIHKAAGPARASRFVRTIAVAAAREDDKAYREALKEAREARN